MADLFMRSDKEFDSMLVLSRSLFPEGRHGPPQMLKTSYGSVDDEERMLRAYDLLIELLELTGDREEAIMVRYTRHTVKAMLDRQREELLQEARRYVLEQRTLASASGRSSGSRRGDSGDAAAPAASTTTGTSVAAAAAATALGTDGQQQRRGKKKRKNSKVRRKQRQRQRSQSGPPVAHHPVASFVDAVSGLTLAAGDQDEGGSR